MNVNSDTILLITAIVVLVELLIFGVMLQRQHLFRWTTFGFWSWAAMLLYFVIAPLSVFVGGDKYPYTLRMMIGGGVSRGIWIAFVIVAGIAVFFRVYLSTPVTRQKAKIKPLEFHLTPLTALIMIILMGFGLYSLLTFRAGLLSPTGDVIISRGRFVGSVTGYQSVAHVFLFIPILLLIILRSLPMRVLGYFLAAAYLFLSLPHSYSRFATVSMLIALTIVITMQSKRSWPPVLGIASVFFLAAVLQIRGHTSWTVSSSTAEILDISSQIPARASDIFTQADTAMLATFYLESFLKDTLTGFDYGLPMINYLATGWIPNRVFPQKYFLVDWLRDLQGKTYPPEIDNLLIGSKSSLIGSFYSNGGIVAVIIEMALFAFLLRKLDGMLAESSSDILRSLGVAWLSTLWMVWGSHDYWGVMLYGTMALPALLIWLFTPKSRPSSRNYTLQGQGIPVDVRTASPQG
jgi:hypothetical protein